MESRFYESPSGAPDRLDGRRAVDAATVLADAWDREPPAPCPVVARWLRAKGLDDAAIERLIGAPVPR